MSNIYLGQDGQYHDDTDENRERFPAADDQAEAEAAPEQADGGTLTETGSEVPPVASESATATAKTRKA